jgi:hypothetical protein
VDTGPVIGDGRRPTMVAQEQERVAGFAGSGHTNGRVGAVADGLRGWWSRHGSLFLSALLVLMAVAALCRFGFEMWRLLGAPGRSGAIDLQSRYAEVRRWFTDCPVYTHRRYAGYPPASYVLLWPLLGWLRWAAVRWLWAVLNLGVLALAVRFLLQHSGATRWRERLFVVFMLLAPYPVPVTLGNGQLGILALTAMVAGIFLLAPGRAASWRRDLGAAGLLLLALVKPSLTAPFFWVVLFRPGGLRPVLYTAAGYVGLTLMAEVFRTQPLVAELATLADLNTVVVGSQGHAHLPLWLGGLGLLSWSTWASLLVLLALGVWVARNRHASLWPILGVTAIAGRLATYHGVYDDSLILLALVALFRAAKQVRVFGGRDVLAASLLALALAPLLAPVTMAQMGLPWNLVHHALQPLVWVAMMIFLASEAARASAGCCLPSCSP